MFSFKYLFGGMLGGHAYQYPLYLCTRSNTGSLIESITYTGQPQYIANFDILWYSVTYFWAFLDFKM